MLSKELLLKDQQHENAGSDGRIGNVEDRAEEEQLLLRLQEVQEQPPASREKGFWEKVKSAFGAS